MRFQKEKDGISVRAISGAYVVILAMNADDQAKDGLLGFAIERVDKTENERYWLKGKRTFIDALKSLVDVLRLQWFSITNRSPQSIRRDHFAGQNRTAAL